MQHHMGITERLCGNGYVRSSMYVQERTIGGHLKKNTLNIPVWEKYILTVEETAAYFRIGEHKLRNLINENRNADYFLWNGNRVQIKRAKFEKIVDTLESI